MKSKIFLAAIILCVNIFLLCSCSEPCYYPNENTGILATVDDSEENYYGIDHLIIQGEKYSIVLDENLNIIHADDSVKLLKPFANFGGDGQYTLYEIETELPFPVYIDNKNRAVFCQDELTEDCKNYFTSNETSSSAAVVISDDNNNKASFN